MTSNTISFANINSIQDLIILFGSVKTKLEVEKHENIIPFHNTYFLITKTVSSKMGTGFFENDENMQIFVISFARFYFEALDQYFNGKQSSSAWQFMFDQSQKNLFPRFIYLLLGVHAHINQDLSICIKELGLGKSFKKDYLAINYIIQGKLAEAVAELNEKSYILKSLLKASLFIYKTPMHHGIVLCRDLAWIKSQMVGEIKLAYA